MQVKLLLLRRQNNLSLTDMAKILGISYQTYRSKENGERQFTLDEMFAIKEYFKIYNLEDIFLPSKHQNVAKIKM